MMRQYFEAKDAHPGTLVAMRVGDFYEFYGEDAETAAAILEITLTGREDAEAGRIPMAGVPYHSVERYLARLIKAGQKVALCDQVEDPKTAKGLVRREVTRVLTPGTLVEDALLSARVNNFLVAVARDGHCIGWALLDPSTGEFLATEFAGEASEARMAQELARLTPVEALLPQDEKTLPAELFEAIGCAVTYVNAPTSAGAERRLTEQFRTTHLGGFGIAERKQAVRAAAMALDYAHRNGLNTSHIDAIATYEVDEFVVIDPSTRRALELTQNSHDGGIKHTLLSVLDSTVTPMGGRLMRRWVEQPLRDKSAIAARHDAVQHWIENAAARADARVALARVADVERLVSRCMSGLASPRDLAALRDALLALPDLDDALRRVNRGRIAELRAQVHDHHDLAHEFRLAITDLPPATLREGGFIRPGFSVALDTLRDKAREGRDYIAKLEAAEREATGIDRLKVGYNSVFGYYLEVSKVHTSRVPDHYIRKQTTANAERYITAELKEHESAVLGADEKAVAVESDLFQQLRNRVVSESTALLGTARAIAELDVLAGLAETAVRRGDVRPELSDTDEIWIQEGRHPVVAHHSASFVPNDLELNETTRLIVLTGPNMSGKSTYLRQAALFVVMAQMGAFVPAAACRLALCDRIFARIGARDEIALGQSTFMVEMVESANILNNATRQSLVILDEVGRGTSTYDGLAIAWAMVESLAELGAKTLFATHYHQLNALQDAHPEIANYRMEVQERGDEVIWTHRVVRGGADKSYGLQVARMAGVPRSVVRRAQAILQDLEKGPAPAMPVERKRLQLSLFEAEPSPVEQALEALDVNQMTPLEAMMTLAEWKQRFRKSDSSG